ncbi:virulence-associated E family protein [Grimontia kaedaensis]|nr:virulence-associated E family protein [Grimontia kaedaensis]
MKRINEQKTPPSPELPDFPHVSERGGQKRIQNTAENLSALLHFVGFKAAFNLMTYRVEVHHKNIIFKEDELRSKLISVSSITGFPKQGIDDHLITVARENDYHPVQRLLAAKKWDGVCRVNEVIQCLPATNPIVAKIALTRWLVGCIASVYEPGFKSKLIPTIKGEQSSVKTAFIQRLASVVDHGFLEGAELNPHNKDQVLTCIRAWIVELGELETTTKHSQGALKAFITKGMDTIRPPFGRSDIHKPRQTNFIGTVNRADFLKDATGNTRYASIEIEGRIDIETVNNILGWKFTPNGRTTLVDPESLIQFWLEVKHWYERGEGWHLSEEELKLIGEANESFVDKGPWYELLKERICESRECSDSQFEWLTAGHICKNMSFPINQSGRVGRALKALVEDGLIEVKKRDGYSLYFFPV